MFFILFFLSSFLFSIIAINLITFLFVTTSAENDGGAHVDYIMEQIASQGISADANYVMNALNFLHNEGCIYTTIDELHFAYAED